MFLQRHSSQMNVAVECDTASEEVLAGASTNSKEQGFMGSRLLMSQAVRIVKCILTYIAYNTIYCLMIFNDVFLYAEPTQEQIKQSICDGTGRWVMSGFLLYIHPPCPVDLNKVLKSSMESAEQVPCLLSVSHGFANAESWFPPVLCLSPFVFLLRKRGNKK